MAIVQRVRRLVNPRTRPKAKGKRKNPSKHRRRLTPAQIKAGFGGKRRQSSLKTSRKRKAKSSHRRRTTNPKPRVRTRTRVVTKTRWRTRVVKAKQKHRRRKNPGLLVTFGPALNPKRRKSVAKTKRRRRKAKSNPATRTRTRVITKFRYRGKRRKSNPGRHRRRRNPSALVGGGMKNMGVMVGGGLIGVTITKTVPGMLPAGMLSSGLMRVVVSAATAWAAGELAHRFVGPEFGKAVFFGGLMQAGSVLLNTFIPSIGKTIGLAGLTPSADILLPYNMLGNRGSIGTSPQARAGMPGTGFAPAFA